MKEKVLTYNIVKELGLDKISVITADMLDGYTSIGYVAFSGCRSLTSIEIPNTITSIGEYAFYGCSGLKSVHTSDIAAWCAISFENHLANPLYYALILYLNGKLITDLVIPNSVTSIGNYAFENCSGLTGELVIPNSVTSIGHSTFYYCTGLTSVTIPDSVTSIGDYAFYYCTSLTSVTIGNGITSIEEYAFYNCRGLKSITIPNGITSIGTNVFFGCSGLTSVKIGNSVTSIGCSAFCYCTDLASVTIGDKTYKSQTVTNGKCKAYKAFKSDMTCRGFQYEEGETYEFEGEPELCRCGFHASLSLPDVFNYYYGKFGKDIVIHEVELEGVSDKKREDSKVVAKKITIGKKIL